jgi:hypothetical protein
MEKPIEAILSGDRKKPALCRTIAAFTQFSVPFLA